MILVLKHLEMEFYDIDDVKKNVFFEPWLPHDELQGKHQWLIKLWKRGVLADAMKVALFVAVTSSTGELPYASDCESDFSITSTGSIRLRKPSKEQEALVEFATALLKGEESSTGDYKASSLLKIVQRFREEFDEPDFVKRVREKLEELSA